MVRRSSKEYNFESDVPAPSLYSNLGVTYLSGCDRLEYLAGHGVDSLPVWCIAIFSIAAKGEGDTNVFAYTFRSRQLVHLLPIYEANSSP